MSSPGPVTTRNWGDPPHNRWSFQHVQELFPTCRLARDPSAAFVLPTEPQDIMQLRFEAADGTSTSICEFLAEACCDAFLVVHNGRVIAEHYFNGMTVRSHHLLNSVTKSFVGMLAGIAVEILAFEGDEVVWRGGPVGPEAHPLLPPVVEIVAEEVLFL